MEAFTTLTSRTFVLPERNIDTDQIIPARFLTTTNRDGLGAFAFRDWRFDRNDQPTKHKLNGVDTERCRVLVAGDNFGCGSSREHAPWALLAFGVRAVVSTSFGDIFASNALKNGLLPVRVPHDVLDELLVAQREVTIDLQAEELRHEQRTVPFATEPFARRCLLDGTDPLGVLTGALPEIEAFERRTRRTA